MMTQVPKARMEALRQLTVAAEAIAKLPEDEWAGMVVFLLEALAARSSVSYERATESDALIVQLLESVQGAITTRLEGGEW